MEKFYTIKQFAELLSTTAETVRTKIKVGKIEVLQLGPRTTRIPESSLRRMLLHTPPKNES